MGYSPWGLKESDGIEHLTHTHTHTQLIYHVPLVSSVRYSDSVIHIHILFPSRLL